MISSALVSGVFKIGYLLIFARGKCKTAANQFGVFRVPGSPSQRPLPPLSTMDSTSQRKKGRDGALSALDVLIQALTLAKDACGVPPAQIALGSAVALLTMIRVRFPSVSPHSATTTF